MDPNFMPYRTRNVLVEERYPCGHGDGHSKGRSLVYYLCKCELCGKEFILSGDDVSKHPYSCGCASKPMKKTEDSGVDEKTKTLLSSRRKMRFDNTSGGSRRVQEQAGEMGSHVLLPRKQNPPRDLQDEGRGRQG